MMTFTLSDKQEKQWIEFQKKHADCCMKKTGRRLASPSGGGFSITFHPTGLGDGVSIKCHFCGETENITDYDTW